MFLIFKPDDLEVLTSFLLADKLDFIFGGTIWYILPCSNDTQYSLMNSHDVISFILFEDTNNE